MATLRNPFGSGSDGPAENYVAITKSDTVDFTEGPARGVFVGVTGDVVAVRLDDTAVTFKNVAAGTILPVICRRVNSTNTTATNMVALY